MKQSLDTPPRSVREFLARTLREDVLKATAYHVADADGMIKLDAMENPYALPAALQDELGRLAARAPLNRYPDADASGLRATLRSAMGLPAGMDLMLGNGSDELIQLLALACARPQAAMLGVEPSFAMYPIVARICGLRFVGVPLRADFSLDPEAVAAAMQRERPVLVFIAYPNNPTGNLFDASAIERVIADAPGIVVVDEAYHPFAQSSFLPHLTAFPNLLVMRTLSKLGLAGLRLGVLIGAAPWIAELNKLRLPYNVNVLTQRIAEHVLKRDDVLQEQAAAIRASRAQLLERLRQMSGVHAYPSDANFVLFRVVAAEAVFESLKRKGILVKKLAGSHPALADCLRVTVGTPDENEAFLQALAGASGA
jgi:histidinol-phosphate aminotransferase